MNRKIDRTTELERRGLSSSARIEASPVAVAELKPAKPRPLARRKARPVAGSEPVIPQQPAAAVLESQSKPCLADLNRLAALGRTTHFSLSRLVNPVNALQTAIALAQKLAQDIDGPQSALSSALNSSLSHVRELTASIENLQALASRNAPITEDVNLNHLALQAMGSMQPQAIRYGIRLSISASKDTSIVRVDERQLLQVTVLLGDLLMNCQLDLPVEQRWIQYATYLDDAGRSMLSITASIGQRQILDQISNCQEKAGATDELWPWLVARDIATENECELNLGNGAGAVGGFEVVFPDRKE